MKVKNEVILLIVVMTVVLAGSYFFLSPQSFSNATAIEQKTSVPAQAVTPGAGIITMIDLGATECIPCKMMAPILEEVRQEYQGRAEIVFIDVWKNPDQAEKYGIQAIPTQIFFDADGVEKERHVGFMDKKSIVAILTRLGAT